MSETVLYARDVEKSWKGRKILNGASLALKLGRVTAVLGPSGAGKSTLLRAIAGLERIDRGLIQAGDETLSSALIHVAPERRDIGLVFQDYALFPHLTALQNVMFGLGRMRRARRRERASALLAAMQLSHRAHAYPHALSGGEQQRVALARALAPDPRLILLDEAFSGLDARLRESMRESTLAALRESGAAVLIVTHDAEEAMFMADDLALMIDGRIVQTGACEDVYLNPVSLAAARLLGDVNHWAGPVADGAIDTPFGRIAADPALEGERAVALARPEGVRLAPSETGAAEIVSRRAGGSEILFEIRAGSGELWRARTPVAEAARIGDRADVTLEPALARVVRG